MRSRRRVVVGVAAVAVVLLVVGMWWLARPSPYRAAFDSIPLGTSRLQAERLLASVPPDFAPADAADAAVLEWQGRGEDGVRHLRIWSDASGNAVLTHPVLSRSRYVNWVQVPSPDRASPHLRDAKTGRDVGRRLVRHG